MKGQVGGDDGHGVGLSLTEGVQVRRVSLDESNHGLETNELLAIGDSGVPVEEGSRK